MSAVLQRLQQLLEPQHPALVLDIPAASPNVEATVYEVGGDFAPIETLQITTEVARRYMGEASRLLLAGDECEIDSFNMQLDELDAGRLLPATQSHLWSRHSVIVVTHPDAADRVIGVFDTEAAWLQFATQFDHDVTDPDYAVEPHDVQSIA